MTQIADYYYKKAKKQGFRARSVFKLEELDQKFSLLKEGYCVLDIGAAPGSWIQYALEKVTTKGMVVGIDQHALRIPLQTNLVFVQEDVLNINIESFVKKFGAFDVVLSDIAPQTTGNRVTDHCRSCELCSLALNFATDGLKKNGAFVCKMYQGQESKGFHDTLAIHFEEVRIQKPRASKSRSKEIFFVCRKFKKK